MARDYFDESKKKKTTTQKAATKTKSQSSSVAKPKATTSKATKAASKSTFLGGGASTQKVQQANKKPSTVKKPATTKKTVTQQERINQKMYGSTTAPERRTKAPASNAQRKANAEANLNLKQTVAQTSRTRTTLNDSERRTNRDANLNLKQTQIQRSTDARQERRAERMASASQRNVNRDANLNLKQTQITASSRQNKELAREAGRDFRNAITDNGAKISKEDDRRARQNQKSGIKSRNETLGIKESATGLTIEGSLRQSIGGHLKSIGDDSNEYQEYKDMLDDGVANGRFTRAEANRALESWLKHSNRFDRYKGWENTKQHETYQKIFKKGEEIYDKGTQQVQSAQEGAGRLKKAYLGALGSGVGMATDMAAGPAWMAAMASRTYGGEIGNAEKEGATRLEDRRYAGLQALKEVGTEGMFSAIGLSAGLLKGRGLFDSFANRLTGRVGESGIRSALRRYGMGIAEENLEEVAGWALDPAIKNLSYGNALWERQSRQTTRDEGDELRNAIASMDENSVRAMAAHLNSNSYLKQISDEMIANGATKEEASKMALAMQGYMNAVLSNNKEAETAYEDRMVDLLKGSNPYKAKLSPSELWDTLSSTTLLTGVTGLGGAVSTAAMGNAIKESNGLGFVKSMSDVVKLFDIDNSVKGQAVSDHIAAGNDVAGTQVSDIADKFHKVKAEGEERYNVSNQLKDRNMKRENLLIQPRQQNPDGTYSLGKVTDFAYDEYIKEALDFIENSGLDVSQEDAEQIADAYGAYKTGVINPDQMFVVNTDNPVARTIFSELADINFDSFTVRDRKGNVDIARTNIATENALYAKAADNYLGYARLEQENWNDEARGQVQKAMSERGQQTMSNAEKVDGHGDIAMTNALETVDPRDRGKFMLMATAASNVYNDARYRNIEWDEAKYEYKEMYKGLDQSALKEVFDAAKTDKINAENKNYGIPVKSGNTMNKQSLQDVGPVRVPGKVIDMRNDQSIKLSEKSLYYTAAPIFGTDFTLVDDLPMRDAQGKVVYRNIRTGEKINEDKLASLNEAEQQMYEPVQLEGSQSSTGIVLNTNAGVRRNIEDIAKHETIHQIRANAPEQFKQLARYLQDKLYSSDSEGFMNTIKAKQEQYKAAGQDLTVEGAMEELIAEGGVNLDWEQLIEDIQTDPNIQEKRTLLESIRDAFREVIAKLRAILSSGNVISEEAREATLDEMLRMDEGYKLLVKAAYAAKADEAQMAIDEWQDKANKQNAPRLSVGEEKYSITTDKEDFIKGANLSKDLRDWAKEMGLDKLSKQPIKGPVIVSVRDLRTAWYEKNGRTDEANVINTALDKIGDSLTQLVGKYQYIDLGDALNAAVTYRTDAEGKPTSVILSCQVKNAEYEVNFDFTTICAKRLAMQKILERFIKTEGERQGTTLYDELKLDEEGLYKLRLILETAGFDVSCRGCFVEQNRYSQQNQARTIANDWNAALDDWARENGTEVTENFGLTTLDIDNLDYEEIEAGFERYHELMKGKKTDVATKNRMLIEASPFFRKRMNASDYASMTGQRALMAIGESKKGGTNLYGLLKRGQSDSKQSVPFTAYNGEISLLPDNMKGKSLYDYLLSIGGARAQSASDFQIEFVYDYMQMVADLSARGLPMHMYTKVIELAELFGMTGIKINLSAMCDVAEDVGGEYAGLKLVDGKYEYNISDQSIDYPKAVELQKRDGYSKNIGIIMVTLSSQHMLKSLDDPDVRYIIGYHSSAMPVVVANMSNMGGATDYTKINKTNKLNEKGQALFDEAMAEAKGNTELEKYKDALRIFDEKIQEETAKKKKKPRRGNEYGAYMSAYGNNTADFNTYDSLLETKDARKTADKYLEHCMKNDLIPIYFPFAFHENYYKCEVYDFNMYDNNTGEYAPMEGVQNIYPGLNMAAGETDTTAFTDRVSQMMDAQNRTNKALDSQYDAVFDEAKNTLKYSITGDDYMDFDASGIDHNELTHRADAPMTAEQQRDADYMDAVNSNNMDEAQRLVDEAAKMAMPNTKLKGRWYHGTENEFTEFNFSQGGKNGTADGFGIYLTNDPEVASSYGNRMIEGYVNVERPASALTTATLTKPELHRLIRRTVDIEAETLQYDGYDSLEDAKKDTWISNYVDTYSAKNLEDAIADVTDSILQFNGNDMDIVQEIMTGMGIRDYDSAMDFYDMLTEETGIDGFETKWGDESEMADPNTPTIALAFRSNQIKSTDPVTYREDGSVIPLSERFDPTNNDIRYSLPTQDADGKILTDGQMEYFKNSQARDEQGRLVPVYHTTNKGGFTIFDPMRSDDHRSLFFAEDWDTSQTYGNYANSRFYYFDIDNIDDVKKYLDAYSPDRYFVTQEQLDQAGGWEADMLDFENVTNGEQSDFAKYLDNPDGYIAIIGVPDYSPDNTSYADTWVMAKSPDELVRELHNHFGWQRENYRMGTQHGYYACYLNLEDPYIIDAHGDNWNEIHLDDYDDDVTFNTREIAEMAMYMDFDGVIIRNLVDHGGMSPYDGMFDYSDIYIAFSSNQVKDVANENPTENPDIRYSVSDEDEAMSHMAHDYAYDTSYEALAYYENLIAADASTETTYEKAKNYIAKDVDEFYAGLTRYADGMKFDDPVLEEGRTRMARSKQDYFNSNVAKWNDAWLTDGEVLDPKSIKKPVKDLVTAVMSESNTNKKYKTDLVNKAIIDIRLAYFYAKKGRTDVADALLWHSAHRMIDGVEFYADDTSYEEYKGLRDYMKNTRIQLGEEYWSDVDFGAFRKENFGRMNLVKGETNVDKIYAELEDMYPGLFDSEEYDNAPDQLMHMASVLDSVQPYAEAYSSEYCAEWATDIASDLLDIMQNGKELQSIADRYTNKYEAKIKAMKARHAEAMLKVRQQRDEGINAQKAKFKEYKEQQKEKRAHDKSFESIQKTHKKLTERLLTNTADKNIPEQYKRELARLLAAFDLQTVGSKKYEMRTGRQGQKTIKMAALKTALTNIENKSHEFHVSDAITDIIDELLGKDAGNGYGRSIEGLTIDELSASELDRIDKLLKALLHEFNTYRNVKIGAKRQQTEDIGKAQVDSALEHAKMFGAGKDYQNIPGGIDRIINLDEVTPAYMFKHIDPEKSGLGLMFKELRRSFDKYVKNQEQLNEWMNDIVGKYHKRSKLPWKKYGAGELENWRSENYAQTFNLENGPVTLTPAQMMSLYCLSKRTQAYNHMTGAGIVVAPVSFNAKLMSDLKKKPNTALPVKLTDADIKQIVAQLTPDQIKVAEDLQQLMAEKMAAWGNEASMNVLGIELFGEPDYFPIKSDKAALEKDLNENEFVEAIRNFGFTKAVQPGARNAIMVDDIFNVVTEHCNNMNLYNAYSEAINDFMKVYNYRDFRDDGSEYTVQQAIAHAYGSKATTFIMTFMRDLNGNVSGRASGIENLYNSLLGNAKKAAVFANLRVAAQQPTAITRAFAVIDPKYLKGIKIENGAMDELFEHCPIALWKSWGYYDINMGKSIEDIMMNNGRWLEDAATELYGALDNVTWTAIWQMVKAEMKDTHPDVKVGSDEYWELCNERMTEVVDLTQVVDSPFHRSHAMRDKGIFIKAATSFMAEPTLTFNMLRDGVMRSREALKKGDKAEAAKIALRIGAVAILQAATVAGAASLVDALRHKRPDKDDEDERFLHLWWVNALENFRDELKVWNKIYFIKDLASIFDGWDNSNLALQGIQKFALGYRQLTEDPYARSSATWYENMADGIGYMTGVPVKTVRTGLKNAMTMLGVSVSALDSVGEKLDSVSLKNEDGETGMIGKLLGLVLSDDGDSLLDKYAEKKGYKKIEKSDEDTGSEKTSESGETEEVEKREQLDYDTMLNKALKAAEGYEGEEYNQRIYSSVAQGMKGYIADGDYVSIGMMRTVIEQAGGDVNYFDQRVMEETKSAYKKSLNYDMSYEERWDQKAMYRYMMQHGMSQEELSSEVLYKSDLAKDMKVAYRIGDNDTIYEAMLPLVDAGITETDLERLYENRNRMDLTKYKQNGRFKDKLKSMGTFIWPTDGVITSHFGYRNAPTAGASSNHPAIDIGAPQGTAVVAADGGVIIYAGTNSGYGNSVGIKHDNGMVTYYNHLYAYNVNVGDTVAQGQQIAQVGSTGISTGPHLDFKILDTNGKPVDPEKYLGK